MQGRLNYIVGAFFRNNMDDWKSPGRYHFDFSTLINSCLDAFEPTGDIEICPS